MDDAIQQLNVARMSVMPPTIRNPAEQREFKDNRRPIFVDDGWISARNPLPDVRENRKGWYSREVQTPEWVRDKILYENTQYDKLPMPEYDREFEETGTFVPGRFQHSSLRRYNDPVSDRNADRFRETYYESEDHRDLLRRLQSETPRSENMIGPMNDLLGFGINADVRPSDAVDAQQRTVRQKPVKAKPFAEGPQTNYVKDNDLEEQILAYYQRNMKAKRGANMTKDRQSTNQRDNETIHDQQARDPKAKRKFWTTPEKQKQIDEDNFYRDAQLKKKDILRPEIDQNLSVDELSINDRGDVRLHVKNIKTHREYDISFNIADDTDLIAELNQHIMMKNYNRVKGTIMQKLSDSEILPQIASPTLKERKTVPINILHAKPDAETFSANAEARPKVKKQVSHEINVSSRADATTDFTINSNIQSSRRSKLDPFNRKISPFR